MKILRYFSLSHSENLSERRRFAFAKKFNQSETHVDRKMKNNKVLKLNLFSAQPETIRNTELSDGYVSLDNDDVKEGDSLPFFQTIELYIDWWIRSKTNSFFEFLINIYPTSQGFNEIETRKNYHQSCISLEALKSKYIAFCVKHGWVARDIEEETWLLNEFGLKIETRHGTSTQVYTLIRWKSPFEKINEIEPVVAFKVKNKHDLDDKSKKSMVEQFLLSE